MALYALYHTLYIHYITLFICTISHFNTLDHKYFDKVLSRKGAAPATGRDTQYTVKGIERDQRVLNIQ